MAGSVLTFVPYKHERSLALGAARAVAMARESPPPTRSFPPLGTANGNGNGSQGQNGQRTANGHSANGHGHVNGTHGLLSPAASSSSPRSPKRAMSAPRRVALTTLPPRRMSTASTSSASEAEEEAEGAPRLLGPVLGPLASPRKGKERAETPEESEEDEEMATGAPATPAATPKAKQTPNGTPKDTPNSKKKANGANGATATAAATGKRKAPVPEEEASEESEEEEEEDTSPSLAPLDVDLAWPVPISSSTRRPAGLHNGSMACYSNATLQVLLHTPPVLREAIHHLPSKCLFRSRHKFCMLCATRELISDHWSGKRSAYRPLPVHSNLSQIKKGFSKNRQEDAHEFFRFVTDAFQNTALAGRPKDLPEKIKRTSWVYRTWGGQVRSRVLCLTCRKPSDTFDSFLDLSLDVPKQARSIADLFKVFCHEDRLDGDNKYNCENCKRKSAATKSMRIADAPPVLTLHLKRFGYSLSWPSRMTKVNSLIEYSHLLDIAPYMVEGKKTSGTDYRLFAVTCHHGSALHYGHYTSYVRGPDGAWYNADDDDMSPVSPKSVLHDKSAYLLSYMRVGKGERPPPSTSASKSSASSISSQASKRRREDESPSPQKRSGTIPGPVRPPLSSSYGANANAVAGPFELSRLEKQYESDSDGMDTTINRLLQPRPRTADLAPATSSPIVRPTHPAPSSPKFKGKFHRPNHKQGIEALRGSGNGFGHGGPGSGHGHGNGNGRANGHGNGNGHGGKRRAANLMPYNIGGHRPREVVIKRKGLLSNMRKKGM